MLGGPLGILLCEDPRHIFLMLGKDADAEVFRILERLQAAEPEVETDQNQNRIQ